MSVNRVHAARGCARSQLGRTFGASSPCSSAGASASRTLSWRVSSVPESTGVSTVTEPTGEVAPLGPTFSKVKVSLVAVSYTHLTLPTNREV